MIKNMRWWDRYSRYIVGLLATAYAIAGGPVWAYFGLYLLATGSWGFCPIFWLLRINDSEAIS